MKIKVNKKEIGTITTNRSLTLKEAMYCLGYDIDEEKDCMKGYENEIEGFYIDDMGKYCFDFENAEMIY